MSVVMTVSVSLHGPASARSRCSSYQCALSTSRERPYYRATSASYQRAFLLAVMVVVMPAMVVRRPAGRDRQHHKQSKEKREYVFGPDGTHMLILQFSPFHPQVCFNNWCATCI